MSDLRESSSSSLASCCIWVVLAASVILSAQQTPTFKSGVEIFHLDVKLGPYLLTTDATLGRTTARRDVRFEIR